MSWSNVTRIYDPTLLTAASNNNFNTSSILPRRVVDETGIIQAVVTTSDGETAFDAGVSTGAIVAQGKLDADAPFADIYLNGVRKEVDVADLIVGGNVFSSVAIVNVPLLYEMRARGEDVNPTNAGAYMSVFIME